MKAALIERPGELEFIDVARPNLADVDGEPILVKLHAGVLCASDFPRFQGGAFNVDFPRPVGDSLHELIGEVIESRSERFKLGDWTLAIPPDQRGLSELVVADASMAVPLPMDYEPREQLILAQPLGTVIWAARKLPNLLGMDAVVIGQGPIGLLFSHLLANLGARRVIGLDKLDYRLDVARQMRATHTVNVDRDDPREAVLEITGGRGADIVIEAVGHQAETLELMIDLCTKHGTALVFGVPDTERTPLPVWSLLRKNLRVVGSVHPEVQRDLTLALDLITSGRIDVSSMITHRRPLADAADAFRMAIEKRDQPIKILLQA